MQKLLLLLKLKKRQNKKREIHWFWMRIVKEQ